jgi:hypothetical protein
MEETANDLGSPGFRWVGFVGSEKEKSTPSGENCENKSQDCQGVLILHAA